MKILLLLLVLISSTVREVSAQKLKNDPCLGSTTPDINNCAKKEYDIADAELNKVYKELNSRLKDVKLKDKLITAQLTWIKYRDENCDFVYELYKTGTIRTVMSLRCLTMTTQSRTKELHIILKELIEG